MMTKCLTPRVFNGISVSPPPRPPNTGSLQRLESYDITNRGELKKKKNRVGGGECGEGSAGCRARARGVERESEAHVRGEGFTRRSSQKFKSSSNRSRDAALLTNGPPRARPTQHEATVEDSRTRLETFRGSSSPQLFIIIHIFFPFFKKCSERI